MHVRVKGQEGLRTGFRSFLGVGVRKVYSVEQKRFAVATYRKLGSYEKTLRMLGYPSRHVLHDWVKESGRGGIRKKRRPRKPARHYTYVFKEAAVVRVLGGEDVARVAGELRLSHVAVLYKWIALWNAEGQWGLMTKKEKVTSGMATRAQLEKSLPSDPEELRAVAASLLVDKAVLERELELVKKDAGVIPGQLSNITKTQIVKHLEGRFPVKMLLVSVGLKASSYYYCCAVLDRPDRYARLRVHIREVAGESRNTYGSMRIWVALRRKGIIVSEKVVRRIMKEEHIPVFYAKRKRRYSSYEGETYPAPPDLVKREFTADEPDVLWLTDVSEFSARDGKVYVSPIIDCFDGKVVSWTTSRHPTKVMTGTMLEQAITRLPALRAAALQDPDNDKPLVLHNDRGGHYRAPEWIQATKNAGISRSMSRKGCSPDNAACEGFFGRMKTEMFYGRQWDTTTELEIAIHSYITFYNTERIKTSLGGKTIHEHRATLAT